MSSPSPNDQMQAYIQQLVQQQILQIQQSTQQQIQQLKLEYESKANSNSSNSPSYFKPSKPPTFNGDRRVNAEIWLLELESYFNVVGISDPGHRVQFAISQFRDSSVIWWKHISKQHPNTNEIMKNWESFKQVVLANYRPVEAAETARASLHRLKQTGTVAAYCDVFLRYLNHIDTMHVQDQLFLFKNGLQSYIAREVSIQHPATLNEAMVFAQRAELESRNYHQNRNRPPFRSMNSHNSAFRSSGNTTASVPMELGNIEHYPSEDAFYEYNQETDQQEEEYYEQSEMEPELEQEQEQSLNAMNNYGRFQPKGTAVRPTFYNNNRVPGLTKEQYEKYRASGACFSCGRTGHMKTQCQSKPKN